MECLGVHSEGVGQNKLIGEEVKVAGSQHPGRIFYVHAQVTKNKNRRNVRVLMVYQEPKLLINGEGSGDSPKI